MRRGLSPKSTIEVLRGVGILGLLLSEVQSYAEPVLSRQWAPALPPRTPAQALYESLLMAAVNGKFQAMLAVAFGAALALSFSASHHAEKSRKQWRRLLGVMFAFGILHGLLVFSGTVITVASAAAFIAVSLLKMSDKALRILLVGLVANIALTVLVTIPALLWVVKSGHAADWDLGTISRPFNPNDQIAVFRSADWVQQLEFRSVYFAISLFTVLIYAPLALTWFVVGILAARTRFQGSAKPLLIAGAVALPLNLLAFLPMESRDAETIQLGFDLLLGPLLGLGYVGLVVGICRVCGTSPVLEPIRRVGRMVFSVYVLQSLICLYAVSGWGLGWFGRLGPADQVGLVAGAWLVAILFAYVWTSFFSTGPVEMAMGRLAKASS